MASQLTRRWYQATAAWYLLMGIGHQLFAQTLFQPVAALEKTQIADPSFYAIFKANYYAGGMWVVLAIILHLSWAKRAGMGARFSEISLCTGTMALTWWGLAIYYARYGAPGAWVFVAGTALVDTICCILA